MKKLILIALVTTLGLSACGVKGPLASLSKPLNMNKNKHCKRSVLAKILQIFVKK